MDCRSVTRSLTAYLEGACDDRSTHEIAAHLDRCVACRAERDALVASWEALGRLEAPQAPADFVPKLMRKIHAADAPVVRVRYALPRLSLRPFAPVFASLAVAVLAVALFWHQPFSVRTPGQTTTPGAGPAVAVMNDAEIVRNLDLLENAELLRNIELLDDLDVIEHMNGSGG